MAGGGEPHPFRSHRVIPAQAGIQAEDQPRHQNSWKYADMDSGLRRNDTVEGATAQPRLNTFSEISTRKCPSSTLTSPWATSVLLA